MDDTERDENTPDAGGAEAAEPAEEQVAGDTPQAESAEPAPEPVEAAESQTADPGGETAARPEDGDGGQEPADAEEPAEQAEQAEQAEPAGERPSDERAPKAKGDEPPGAGLEPIRLEPDQELSAEERARLEAEAEERARREAEATAEAGEEELTAREAKLELAADARVQATGKRKSAVARVILSGGGGSFEVNGQDLHDYFPRSLHQTIARQALVVSGYEGQVDVRVRVHGGGLSGQADAVRHGVARALTEVDGELRGELKRRGMLTRDARVKERRKAGLKKARKRPQFSKR